MFDYEQRENTDGYRNNFDGIFRDRSKTRRKDRFDKEKVDAISYAKREKETKADS